MTRLNVLSILLMSLIMNLSQTSFGCGDAIGWANPDEVTSRVTMQQAVEVAKTMLGVAVKKSSMQAKCGDSSDYEVTDIATGKSLGVIPIPYTAEGTDDGRYLTARLGQLLKTPREQLISLAELHRKVFFDDVEALEEDLQIGAYVPNAFPIEKRTANNGQDYFVEVTIEEACSERGSLRPSTVYQNLAIKTLEYIPGRTDYNPSSIYQSGDLKKAILSNSSIMGEIKKQVSDNIKYCRSFGTDNQKWENLTARLNEPTTQLLKSTVDIFSGVRGIPTAAYMLNAHRIAVVYEGVEQQFAGTTAEMVQIQKLLAKQGIQTDKRSRLDFKGKIELDVANEYHRSLPASLQ
jgi:hypothetical protein